MEKEHQGVYWSSRKANKLVPAFLIAKYLNNQNLHVLFKYSEEDIPLYVSISFTHLY